MRKHLAGPVGRPAGAEVTMSRAATWVITEPNVGRYH